MQFKLRFGAFVIALAFAFQSTWIQAETTAALPLSSLSVPETLGNIEDRFEGESGRWVIQIQDVHAHFIAQENIAAIIDHINRHYGLGTIAMEGGWSESSFKQSWELPESREKQLLARALLEEAHIGGPVYAALFSETPMKVIGIENEELYEKNMQSYRQHIRDREETNSKLIQIDKALESTKALTYNSDLLLFDKELNRFRDGQKAEIFLPSLIGNAKIRGISFSDLPQVQLFETIMAKEGVIRKEKLKDEADRLMHNYKSTRLSFEELLRSGKLSHEKIEFYPETKKYLELIQLQDGLAHLEFFSQIDTLTERVKNSLFASDEERSLDQKAQNFQLIKKTILFQATPENIRDYETLRSSLKADVDEWRLGEALSLAIKFYDIARERDRIFFDKIVSDGRLKGNIILVTGGFHTDGLSELFRKSNISYMTIRPEIGKEGPKEDLYFERLNDAVPRIQTLSHEQNRYAFLDKTFPAGVAELRRTNNIFKGVERAVQYEVSAEEVRLLAPPISGVVPDEFMSLADSDRRVQAENIFVSAKEAKLPISIVVKSTTLAKLLKDPVGLTVWEEVIASDRTNQIVIIRDSEEIMDATIGVRARIVRVDNENMTIGNVLDTRLRNSKAVAVIDAEYLKEGVAKQILVLPPHPASLLLARVMLESGAYTAPSQDFLAALSSELNDIFQAQGLLRESA